jgi:hypothetical protein
MNLTANLLGYSNLNLILPDGPQRQHFCLKLVGISRMDAWALHFINVKFFP